MQVKKIVMASDHAGCELKNALKEVLQEQGYEILDKGPETDAQSVDYPDYAFLLAKSIQKKEADKEDYSTVLHVSVLISILIYLVLFFIAPYIAKLYQQAGGGDPNGGAGFDPNAGGFNGGSYDADFEDKSGN